MTTTEPTVAPVSKFPRAGAVFAILAIIAVLPLFWPGLIMLAAEWATPEYSHGPAVALLSGYLFLRALQPYAPDHEVRKRIWPGLVAISLGLLLALFGNVARIGDVVAYGLIIWIIGLMLTITGWSTGKRLIVPLALLVFVLPLPQILYWKLTIWLQLISSQIGVWVIALAGVPVYLEGNVIDLGVYQLQVAEACAGLRYLIPIISLSIVVALLYEGPRWHKVLLVLAAGPLTVCLNAFRIGVVGLLVNAAGIEQAEGFLHVFEGWVTFASCMGLLLALAWGLHRSQPREVRSKRMLNIELTGLGIVLARFGQIRRGRGLIIAVVLGAMASGLAVVAQAPRPDQVSRQPFALFPNQIDTWRGVRRSLDPGVAGVLAADDYLDVTYIGPDRDQAVNLFVAWYMDQADGSGIHSPSVCLPANGWEIFEFASHNLDMSDTPYGRFDVNRAIIQNGLQQQLVYYWFEQRGERQTNDFVAKAKVIYDGVVTGRTDGALVRYITAIDADEPIAQADARLTAFIAQSIETLPPFVPF